MKHHLEIDRVSRFGTTVATVSGEDLDPGRAVIFYGGWQQDPAKMVTLQKALASQCNRPSIGMSAIDFDLRRAPLSEPMMVDDVQVPPRMVQRADIINTITEHLIREKLQEPPSLLVTHCAGIETVLVAQQRSRDNGEISALPTRGVAAEPMISGEPMRMFMRRYAEHERAIRNAHAAAEPTDFISLTDLERPGAVVDTAEKKRALDDIINCPGISLFAGSLAAGAEYSIVVGSNDVAAPDDAIQSRLVNEGLDPGLVHHYPAQTHRGHGYLLYDPKEAVPFIGTLLDSLQAS